MQNKVEKIIEAMNQLSNNKRRMKKATVKLKLGGKDRTVFVTGKIKDTRKSFNREEYLITKGKIDDFWVRNESIVFKDK